MNEIVATFIFNGKPYDVVAISAAGLQVECASGFPDETISSLAKGSFEFLLRDTKTQSEVELVGEFLRSERAEDSGKVVRIWIAKNENNLSRPLRRDGASAAIAGEKDDISLEIARRSAGNTIAVGGGKGGVGKTIVAVNLALSLSRLQKKITLFDGDFGNSNCNTMLGITRVENSLEEYLRKERSFGGITVSTAYPGLRLICGAQNKVDVLLAAQMPRLLTDIRQIQADSLIIDLGAGISDKALDLYRLADEKLIVVTPQVTSLQNAYSFIKSAFFHDLRCSGGLNALLDAAGSDPQKLRNLVDSLDNDKIALRHAFAVVLARQNFKIVGNMVNDEKDLKIVQNLQKVVQQYMRIDNVILGSISTSDEIRNSVNRITPFVVLSPDTINSREMKRMAALLAQSRGARY